MNKEERERERKIINKVMKESPAPEGGGGFERGRNVYKQDLGNDRPLLVLREKSAIE